MNCHSVRKHIVEKVSKIVNKEVAELCSTRKPSILRKIDKEDLEKFDLQLVCDEWRERASVFHSFLLTSAINKTRTVNKRFSEPSRQVYKDILLIDHNCLNCPLLMSI